MCRAKSPVDLSIESDPLQYVEGPPFPLSACELTGMLQTTGLEPRGHIEAYWDTSETPRPFLQALFTRP